MNDNEKEFEKFVREIKFDDTPDLSHRDKLEQDLIKFDDTPDLSHRDKLEQDLVAVLERQPRQKEQPFRIWRIIMKSRITKLAAAAVIVGAVILSIHLWDNSIPSAYAFEQTVAAMQGKRSFHIQTYYDSPTKFHDEFWAEFDEHGKVIRIRQLDQWRKKNWPVEVLWENQVQHKYTPGIRRPGYRRSGILEISKTRRHVDESKLEEFDPETMIEEVNRNVENGQATVKVDDLLSPDGNLVVEVTTTYDPYRIVMLVDPETKLVLRMDQYQPDDEGNEEYNRGIEVLEYNRPFDPRLFKPDFPRDTIIINQLSREVGMAQGDLSVEDVAHEILRRALEAWAEDDYETTGLLFGGAPKEFFMQRASLKPVGDINLGEPKFDPIEPGRPRFRINCRYVAEHEGRQTTIYKCYWVTTVEGQPGRWFIIHSVGAGKDMSDDFMKDTTKSERFSFKDNYLDYQPISTPTKFFNKDFKLPFLGLAKDDTFLYIKLVYDSPIRSRVGVRLAGDAPGLKEFLPSGTEIGKNLLIIQLKIEKVVTFSTHICVEIGDNNSVVIQKDIVDAFITDTTGITSERFSFKDNYLDYQPISTPTKFANRDFKLPFLGLAKDDTFLYIKLVYDSPIRSRIGVRLAGDAPGLKEFLPYGTEIGKNLLIIKLKIRKVVKYSTHICVEIGDDHSVVIKKDIVDAFITDITGITSEGFSFKDNNLDYQSISTSTEFFNKDFKLPFLGLAKDDTFLYIKLVYDSPIKSRVGVRLAGDAPGLWEFMSHGTEIGKNLLIIKFKISKVLKYSTHICVEIGDDHSVVINKDMVDAFITDTIITSGGFSFKDNNLDYQPISTPTKFDNKNFKLPFLGLAKDDTFLYIKLVMFPRLDRASAYV
jgi:hypothetical protein